MTRTDECDFWFRLGTEEFQAWVKALREDRKADMAIHRARHRLYRERFKRARDGYWERKVKS